MNVAPLWHEIMAVLILYTEEPEAEGQWGASCAGLLSFCVDSRGPGRMGGLTTGREPPT